MRRRFQIGTEHFDLDLTEPSPGTFHVRPTEGSTELAVEVLQTRPGLVTATVGGRVMELALVRHSSDSWSIAHQGRTFRVSSGAWLGRPAGDSHAPPQSSMVCAPMPGRIIELKVQVATELKQGSPLLVIEAMKMQNELLSERTGQVLRLCVAVGDTVEAGAPLLEIG